MYESERREGCDREVVRLSIVRCLLMMVALFLLCFALLQHVNAGNHNDKATVHEQHEETRYLLNNGDLKGLDLYFSKHSDAVNHLYSNGRTLLWFAVFDGKPDAVRYLLKKGSDPNVGGGKYGAPLWALVGGMESARTPILDKADEKMMKPYLEIAVMLFDASVNHHLAVEGRGFDNEVFLYPVVQEIFELICAKDVYLESYSRTLDGTNLQRVMRNSQELIESPSVRYARKYGFLSSDCLSLLFPRED